MRGLNVLLAGVIAATAVGAAGAAEQAQGAQAFEGKQKYDIYCATCHGAAGKGDGVLASSLRKRPADLTQLARKNQGKFPAEAIVTFIDGRTRDEAHTKSDMPVWGEVFSKSQDSAGPDDVKSRIEALVKYLETIQDTRQRPE
jgi:mono/diheme cytochrome c family protein